jgi:hypothetical protein
MDGYFFILIIIIIIIIILLPNIIILFFNYLCTVIPAGARLSKKRSSVQITIKFEDHDLFLAFMPIVEDYRQLKVLSLSRSLSLIFSV